MKVYEFVEVKVTGLFQNGSTEHRDIIADYAALGYRYVGYIPIEFAGYGEYKKIDLIFEKDDDQNHAL